MKTPAMTEAVPTKVKTVHRTAALQMTNYFVNHPKMPMSASVSHLEKQILSASMKRLLQNYEMSDVKLAIDRFFTQGIDGMISPAKVFISTKVQERLLNANKILHNDVDKFIANGFERTQGMTLPWPEYEDDSVRRRVLRDPDSLKEIVSVYLRNA